MRIRKVTEREKAIILWSLFTEEKSLTKTYLLTKDREGAKLKYPNSMASSWRRLDDIERAYTEALTIKNAYDERIKKEGVKEYLQNVQELRNRQNVNGEKDEKEMISFGGGEIETDAIVTELQNLGFVDFTNRAEFLDYLNRKANEITDEKQRNDILKMLSDLLRFKEDKPNTENEIQRFYVPITCHNCELYRREETGKD